MKRKHHWVKWFHGALLRRTASLALAVTLLCGLIPIQPAPAAQAAEWMEPYLEQIMDWGVMLGDSSGNLYPDREISRAEFVVMMNRAFGYSDIGPNPFVDVPDSAWYAEDIRIARQAGYFNGTSPTTASPNDPVTREQAAVLLGRSLRLQESPGAITSFTDNQDIGVWSRSMVQEAANLGIIQGYEDGTFRPKTNITRGQFAVFLVRALGNLIQEPGEVSSGGVYGNLTINTPGVSLKDTVVTGNLYLTGGVGLGNIDLENVNVLGKIVVCGAGESQGGQNSLILRNVTADTLEIDSLTNQFMTVQSEGLTNIANTIVRTSAYLEDLTDDGLGLRYIELNGDANTQLQLAGNIKEVMNVTPNSSILVAQGITNKLTVDEKAVGSALTIDNSAGVREVNLDVGVPVTGTGSISSLHVSASGSTVSMLPDNITVRPGITSTIYSENMDSTLAAESSDDPRLLTGYPTVKNIASTSADVVFSTNKHGTIYWAVTALTDGSLSERELVNPSTAAAKILKSGTINATASNTEYSVKLTGLTMSGSYYVSALVVDNRDRRSPVKVAAFTTTDDSVPNFSSGYPTTILTTANGNDQEQIIQSMVMATKSCQLYYALLPRGSTTPTTNALKSGAVTGNLGFGIVDVQKDTPYLIPKVNSSYLAELTQYDLYLWLNDADSGKSSAVKKLSVTTLDKTPPVVTNIYQSNSAAKTATITFSINEDSSTLYWAVVPSGSDFLRPTGENEEITPDSLAAKVQVEAGTYSTKNGRASASKADTNYTFTISGLTEQMSYDLYYVAKDKAGNYSDAVLILRNVKTLDESDPTVEQQFSLVQEDSTGVERPLTESDVILAFSEVVCGKTTVNNQPYYVSFQNLYDNVYSYLGAASGSEAETKLNQAKKELDETLREYIEFYRVTSTGRTEDTVFRADLADQSSDEWDIDFREAVISQTDGKMSITFPAGTGINLQSGATYYFRLKNISDTSGNVMNVTTLPEFTTLFATAEVSVANTVEITRSELLNESDFPTDNNVTYVNANGVADPNDLIHVNLSFTVLPQSTDRVPSDIVWDMLLWTDTTMEFELYSKAENESSWTKEGTGRTIVADKSDRSYVGLNGYQSLGNMSTFPPLRELPSGMEVEYAVHITSISNSSNPNAWIENVTMKVSVVAGGNPSMRLASPVSGGNQETLDMGISGNLVVIGESSDVIIPPQERTGPIISQPYPSIAYGDTGATVTVILDRPGTVYCTVVPLTNDRNETINWKEWTKANPSVADNSYNCAIVPDLADNGGKPNISDIPVNGNPNDEGSSNDPYDVGNKGKTIPMVLSQPTADIVAAGQNRNGVVSGRVSVAQANFAETIQLDGLKPNTTYLMYLTARGTAVYSDVHCYTFTTEVAVKPVININRLSTNTATITVDKSSTVYYALMPTSALTGSGGTFSQPFSVAAGTAIDAWTTASQNPPYNNVKTVLDAMLMDYVTGGSVFDNFAVEDDDTHSLRSICASIIQQTSQESVAAPAMQGTLTLTVGSGQNSATTPVMNMTGMDPSGQTYYTLLAVGQTVNSSQNAFRASQSYYNMDNSRIYVVDPSLGNNTYDADNTHYSGTLYLDFSDEIYYRFQTAQGTGDQAIYPVDNCPLGDGSHSESNNVSEGGYKNIGSFMTLDSGITYAPTRAHDQNVGRSLTFTLTAATAGARIRLSNICKANGNVRTNTVLTLTLRRRTVVIDDPTEEKPDNKSYEYEWYFEVPDEWTQP